MEIVCPVGGIGWRRRWVLIKMLLLLMLELMIVTVMVAVVVVSMGMIGGVVGGSCVLAKVRLRMLNIDGRVHGLAEYRHEK